MVSIMDKATFSQLCKLMDAGDDTVKKFVRGMLKIGLTSAVGLVGAGMAEVLGNKYDAIVTNPPIRAGKQVIYKMFADAAVSLKEEGALYLVIRKQQGAESCVKYLKTLFNIVEKLDKSAGFWVLKASEPKVGSEADE